MYGDSSIKIITKSMALQCLQMSLPFVFFVCY
jgi:hypothetical protein